MEIISGYLLQRMKVKTRFEKDKSPSSAEFETPEYNDREPRYKNSIQILPLIFQLYKQRQQQDQVHKVNINITTSTRTRYGRYELG